jgi:hypothetical protein
LAEKGAQAWTKEDQEKFDKLADESERIQSQIEAHEKMIAKEYNVKLDLSQASQKEKANALIQQYMQKKFALTTNGVKSNMEFVGFEIQQESTWSYFEVKNVKQLKQLKVFCEILFGIDKQQINIIHVKSGGVRKSFELATPANSTTFLF